MRRFALSTSTPPSLPPGWAKGTARNKTVIAIPSLAMILSFLSRKHESTKKRNCLRHFFVLSSFRVFVIHSLFSDAHHCGPLLGVQPFEVAGGDINLAVVDDRAAVD